MASARSRKVSTRIRVIQLILLVLVGLISLAALILPISLSPGALPLTVGDVAPRDLQAPEAIEYVSEVRTEEARTAAERAVPQTYSPPDPSIARDQIEHAALPRHVQCGRPALPRAQGALSTPRNDH